MYVIIVVFTQLSHLYLSVCLSVCLSLPLLHPLVQGLADVEETVVYKALEALRALCALGKNAPACLSAVHYSHHRCRKKFEIYRDAL